MPGECINGECPLSGISLLYFHYPYVVYISHVTAAVFGVCGLNLYSVYVLWTIDTAASARRGKQYAVR